MQLTSAWQISLVVVSLTMLNYQEYLITQRLHYDRLPPEQFLVRPYTNQCLWHLLPNLSSLDWPETAVSPIPTGRQLPNGTIYYPPATFGPKMSRGQRQLVEHLLHTFAQLMFDNGMGDRFFLMGGTLLGSYRHHDLIPWDDDVDVLVDYDVRPRMLDLLQSLGPNYILFEQGHRLKVTTRMVYSENDTADDLHSRILSPYSTNFWPFLDISYYKVKSEYVYEIISLFTYHFHWPKSMVFPLIFRPIGKHWYPVPYRTQYFMRKTHPLGPTCLMRFWTHVLSRPFQVIKQSCRSLAGQYAFVERGPLIPPTRPTELPLIKETLQQEELPGFSYIMYHDLYLPAHPEDANLDPYDYTM